MEIVSMTETKGVEAKAERFPVKESKTLTSVEAVYLVVLEI
tara:strand:- start:980 stop:1102 length:123 start_codon:yes stop_codon:yes gene_type:complete